MKHSQPHATRTADRKRFAWRDYRQTGRLPADPDIRDLCEKLQRAEVEFAQLHTLAPAGER